jgi:hypothetical protein
VRQREPLYSMGMKLTRVALLMPILIGAPLNAAPNLVNRIERPLRYRPEGHDFVIENGGELFNRPLYGGNTAFRVDAGDKPELLLYLPGRGGNLRIGLRTEKGALWAHDAARIVCRYRPGAMLYEVRDALLGEGVVLLTVLARDDREGLILRAEQRGTVGPLEIVWAFGGVTGQRGRRDGDIGTESVPISQYFQLQPEHCRDNAIVLADDGFLLRSKAATLIGRTPRDGRQVLANARHWDVIEALLAPATSAPELPLVVGRAPFPAAEPVYLSVERAARAADDRDELQIYKDVRRESPGSAPPGATNLPIDSVPPEDLPAAFDAVEGRRQARATQVVIDTPDPHLNAAVAALCVAADGVWDEPGGAVMHGAVAWRSKLLGWRGAYALDALGWHERARRHLTYWASQQNAEPIPDTIQPADPTANLARNEPALHTNGDLSRSHYDMNLVYIDALLRHLLWTGDLDFARKVWPVIERHLAWERRLFRRPFGDDGLPLYEAYAAIWASDDLAYHGGGATHSSAYNHYHNKMAARLARTLGHDPAPYEREADLILRAMRRELWLKDRGWYAEWKDLLGNKLVHPQAGLWTVYHAIDSGAVTPCEAWQLTRYVDSEIPHIPVRGPGVPNPRGAAALVPNSALLRQGTSEDVLVGLPEPSPMPPFKGDHVTLATTSWMPYTWSTNNVVMAEVAHTALAYWQAGRRDEALRIFKGAVLDSMYMGLCPGNVGMTTAFDMARGESQRDFADAAGIVSRSVVEGLFGVKPDALAGELVIRTGFPAEWDHASLHHPDLDLAFQRKGHTWSYVIESRFAQRLRLRLQVAAPYTRLESIIVNGHPATWRSIEDAVEAPLVEVQAEPAERFEVTIVWKHGAVRDPGTQNDALRGVSAAPLVTAGRKLEADFLDGRVIEIADPQGALSGVRFSQGRLVGTAVGMPGHRTVFAKLERGAFRWWQSLPFEIRLPYEIAPSATQTPGNTRLRIRNNSQSDVSGKATVETGARAFKQSLKIPAWGLSEDIALGDANERPGTRSVHVRLPGGATVDGFVTDWTTTAASATRWEPVPLDDFFNDSVARIFKNEYLSPRSPYCSLAIPKQGIGSWCRLQAQAEIDDGGLRAAAARNGGRFVLPQGVPFVTPTAANARNIVFTSQWDNFPREVRVPLTGRARHVYLLMAGSTSSMQSRFDNGEVIVRYADGTSERLALHNPTNWWPIDQDYLIDDFAFRRPESIPPRVDLKTGEVRTLEVQGFKGRGGPVPGGAASVLDLSLDPKRELEALTVRALANEVVIGLMSVTLVRAIDSAQ